MTLNHLSGIGLRMDDDTILMQRGKFWEFGGWLDLFDIHSVNNYRKYAFPNDEVLAHSPPPKGRKF